MVEIFNIPWIQAKNDDEIKNHVFMYENNDNKLRQQIIM